VYSLLLCCAVCFVFKCLLNWAGSFFYNVFMSLSGDSSPIILTPDDDHINRNM
jgi:hypothetical protein